MDEKAILEQRCAELEQQVVYYKILAAEMGKKRFREVEQLSRLISKIKDAEKERRLSNDRLLTILDSIDAHIYVADMETYEILYMNENMVQDFGDGCVGEICWKIFRNEPEPCAFCNNPLLLDEFGRPTGVHSWQGKNPLTGKYYMNYDRAIEWIDGRIVRLQISMDITEHLSMEDQLRQKYKMEAVGFLAGGVAHNFNNNLAIILGNIELAKLKIQNDEDLKGYLENAKTVILRSRDLIQQILTYSRKGDISKVPVRLQPIVDETINLLRATIPTTINLNCEITPDCQSVYVNADVGQVQEVLINLCNNAVYAMDENGSLAVLLENVDLHADDVSAVANELPGQYAKLSVMDYGTGMSEDTQNKIFDPFFTTKEAHEGTGMGLATVQGIMEQHEGFIKVKSTLGQGSTFELFFPSIETEKESVTFEPRNLARGTEKILFVDDDAMLADICSQMLEEAGYQVVKETNSAKALRMFREAPDQFDLVITDQTMPEITGKELIEEILKIRQDFPTILFTGFSSKISKKEAEALGVRAYCEKPLEFSELVQITRTILDGSGSS